jgi:hypothetical protein
MVIYVLCSTPTKRHKQIRRRAGTNHILYFPSIRKELFPEQLIIIHEVKHVLCRCFPKNLGHARLSHTQANTIIFNAQ